MVDDIRAETLESVRGVNHGDVGVQIFFRILIVVVLALDLNANALRDLCDARARESRG